MSKNLKFAFIQTIPVLLGYIFLGIAFGLLLQKSGYNFFWALFISIFVYAGSMQFILVGILGSGIGLLSIIVVTLSINSRHIFYGLSFIETFKRMGKAYPYMIFSLTDETYSLLCGTKIPTSLDNNRVLFMISSLNHFYWVAGSVTGAVLGEVITFNSTGIDFAMTALFVVIFTEQWLSTTSHLPAVIGIASGITALLIVGPDGFILPALLASIGLLLLFKRKMSQVTLPDKEELSHDSLI